MEFNCAFIMAVFSIFSSAGAVFLSFLQQYSEGVIMAQWVGRWTYVQEVAGSTHGHDVAV